VINVPHNLEAEKIVLSVVLMFPERAPEIVDSLAPADFFDPRHQEIFKAVSEVVQHKEPIDLATISDRLNPSHGGIIPYLSSIADNAPHSECAHHIRTILEDSALRTGIDLCDKARVKLSNANGNATDVIDEVQSDILGLTIRGTKEQFVTAYQGMLDTMDRYRQAREGKDIGVKTGYFLMDQATGGLRGSKFIVIAGRPGQGKTSLAINLIRNMCKEGYKCGLFSLEMDKEQIEDRMISLVTGINSLKLTQDGGPSADMWPAISHAAEEISKWPLLIDDEGGLTISEIKRRARLMRKDGVEIIFIDQLSKIRARGKDRFEQKANAVTELSPLAKELRIPIVLLAQINREAEKRGGGAPDRNTNKPRTWMLKDTGALEEDADIILLVYRPSEYTHAVEDEGFANIEIAKHRGGPCIDIELEWDGKRMQFKDPIV